MNTFKEFEKWDNVNKTCVAVRPEFTRIAGNGNGGLVLSQIFYWVKPKENGKTKLTVFKYGVLWLAKSHEELALETGLTVKEVRAALKKLKEQGIIQIEIIKFYGAPTTHISLVKDVFIREMNIAIDYFIDARKKAKEKAKEKTSKPANALNCPNGQIKDFQPTKDSDNSKPTKSGYTGAKNEISKESKGKIGNAQMGKSLTKITTVNDKVSLSNIYTEIQKNPETDGQKFFNPQNNTSKQDSERGIQERQELEQIYENCEIDKTFTDNESVIKNALKNMFDADWISVDKKRVPQITVRQKMKKLNGQILDSAFGKFMSKRTEIKRSHSMYLFSCIYHEILEFDLNKLKPTTDALYEGPTTRIYQTNQANQINFTQREYADDYYESLYENGRAH